MVSPVDNSDIFSPMKKLLKTILMIVAVSIVAGCGSRQGSGDQPPSGEDPLERFVTDVIVQTHQRHVEEFWRCALALPTVPLHDQEEMRGLVYQLSKQEGRFKRRLTELDPCLAHLQEAQESFRRAGSDDQAPDEGRRAAQQLASALETLQTGFDSYSEYDEEENERARAVSSIIYDLSYAYTSYQRATAASNEADRDGYRGFAVRFHAFLRCALGSDIDYRSFCDEEGAPAGEQLANAIDELCEQDHFITRIHQECLPALSTTTSSEEELDRDVAHWQSVGVERVSPSRLLDCLELHEDRLAYGQVDEIVSAMNEYSSVFENAGASLPDGVEQSQPRPPRGRSTLSSGLDHSCAVREDGTVWCWGNNESGQLGDGSTLVRPHAVRVVGLDDAVAVAAGSGHTCALRRDGTAVCWGRNRYWQIGDGTEEDRTTPALVRGLSGATAIVAGGAHTCAIASNGRVACWGNNQQGQLGLGDRRSRTGAELVEGLDGVVSLALGQRVTYAHHSDGSIYYWGEIRRIYRRGEMPRSIVSESPQRSSSLGAVRSVGVDFVIRDDGTLHEWNDDGSELEQVEGLDLVVHDARGVIHSCCLRDDGRVLCRGQSAHGEIGNGEITEAGFDPVLVLGLQGVEILTAGGNHSCALLSNGTVSCWGRNDHGTLGDGVFEVVPTPSLVEGLDGVMAMSSYAQSTVALLDDGSMMRWGGGDGVPEPIEGVNDAASAGQGGRHACAIRRGGSVVCWGANRYGQLGDGTTVRREAPVDVTGVDSAMALALGNYHSCALLEDRTVHCWGSNRRGTLGTGGDGNQITPAPVGGIADVREIAAGDDRTCALVDGGRVVCWGSGVGYWLRDIREQTRTEPVEVPGLPNQEVSSITMGRHRLCALLADGSVRCIGHYYDVHIQDPDWSDEANHGAHAIAGLTGVTNIAIGNNHNCAVLESGVRCWGYNHLGQLGVTPVEHHREPVVVPALRDVVSLSAGANHTCARLESGRVACFGHSLYGALGDGHRGRQDTPHPVWVCESGTWNGTRCEGGELLDSVALPSSQ